MEQMGKHIDTEKGSQLKGKKRKTERNGLRFWPRLWRREDRNS
jgi:hypothetical protein